MNIVCIKNMEYHYPCSSCDFRTNPLRNQTSYDNSDVNRRKSLTNLVPIRLKYGIVGQTLLSKQRL